jgi:hypothetical protein
VSAAVRREHVGNLVSGNRHPFTVHPDFIMVANSATLGRAAIRLAAARTLAIISCEPRVEVPMPFMVADPVMPFLRVCACRNASGKRGSESRNEPVSHIHPPERMEARAFSLANV